MIRQPISSAWARSSRSHVCEVVVRQDEHVPANAGGLPRVFRDRRGSGGIEPGRRRPHAHRHVLVGAVVAALELRELRLAGEGPRRPDRHQRALGARIGEADRLERGHAIAQEPREADLGHRRRAEGRSLPRLLAQRLGDGRMPVTEDEARRVQHEVEVAVAVDVVDVVALARLGEERIRREVRGAARAAAGHDVDGLLLEGARPRGPLDVALDLPLQPWCRHDGLPRRPAAQRPRGRWTILGWRPISRGRGPGTPRAGSRPGWPWSDAPRGETGRVRRARCAPTAT